MHRERASVCKFSHSVERPGWQQLGPQLFAVQSASANSHTKLSHFDDGVSIWQIPDRFHVRAAPLHVCHVAFFLCG